MNKLQMMAEDCGTDKAWHRYPEIYEPLMAKSRDFPVRFMEHGLLGGNSADMWSQWFQHPDARLHFVDIEDRGYKPKDPRIILHFGSAADPAFMYDLYRDIGPLDYCCDDASHICSQQIEAFNVGWQWIRPGGLWCIEDIHAVHSVQHCDMPTGNIIEHFARMAVEMQDRAGATGCAAPLLTDVWHSIESVEFRKGLIIIRKRS